MMSKYDINCLRYIVLNICNMCNCRCRICPQSLEPYRENHKNEIMDVDTAWILKKRLDDINYKGIVSISGMGEPTLNIYLKEILKILSKNREYKLWIVTNGLRLLGEDKYILNVLLEYCDRIDISIHDMDKYYNDFKELQKSSEKIYLRNHDINNINSTLIASNRGGSIDNFTLLYDKNNPCYYPYYELCIDCSGEYLLCAHDFNKESKDKKINIFSTSIEEYFLYRTYNTKYKMCTTRRHDINPCNKCTCIGILDGIEEYRLFEDTYLKNNK